MNEKKNILLMPDYGCWPLWLMTDIGLVNINPSNYISDNKLMNDINDWSDIYTSVDPQDNFEKDSKDYVHEIKGIFYCQQLKNNYNVHYHSNILSKRSSDLTKLLNELLEELQK